MNSSRSYIVNALIDWIVDNDLTPHIVLDASYEDIEVPQEFVREGRIVLNVSGSAVQNFRLAPDGLEFDARFSNLSRRVKSPVGAIIGIYARENGQGMVFEPEKLERTNDSKETPDEPPAAKLPSHLRLVKE